jgi:hypothetical protein
MLAPHQSSKLYEGRLISKNWRGHPKPAKQNKRRPRTAHHKPVLNSSVPTQPSDRPTHVLTPEIIHNPTQQHISQSSPHKNSSKRIRATQNRQALSLDSNSRWVPFWTLNSFCHPGWTRFKFHVCSMNQSENLTPASSLLHPTIPLLKLTTISNQNEL